MNGFKNANIYVENEGVMKTSLTFEKGIIQSIGPTHQKGLIELPENAIVVPGFIDEHIHGCHGHDVMDASSSALVDIANQLLQEGVTYFCPTTMSMSLSDIKKALTTINHVKESQTSGAEIIGVHLEGPFLSEKFCGAQDPQHLLDCDEKTLVDLIKTSRSSIRIVTFATERNGMSILPTLKKEHITPSLGHSDATGEQAHLAIEAGARCATHCYNAMRGIHHRDVGLLGAVMLDDRVMCELIADLKHVSPDAIRLLFKNKGKDRVILVSDSMEAKYLPEGEYALGGQKVFVKDYAARLASGVLAGSVLRLDDALKNISKTLPELTFTEIIDLVTKNPANNLGMPDIGSIKVGNRARFTIVDKDFNVLQTIF